MNPSRREVLTRLTVCGACAAVGLCTGDLFAGGPKGETIDLAPLSEFPTDDVYDTYARSRKLFILRKDGKLHAASALCTHKGALVNKQKDGSIMCPKHKTIYDNDGISMKGPGKASLPRFAIKIENGRVIVDTTKVFEERQWDDPAASATIEETK